MTDISAIDRNGEAEFGDFVQLLKPRVMSLVVFTAMVGLIVFNTFNARTQGLNLFENLLENRLFLIIIPAIMAIQVIFVTYGGEVLRTVGLTVQEWGYVLIVAFVIIPADLLRKVVRNHWFGNPVIQNAVST